MGSQGRANHAQKPIQACIESLCELASVICSGPANVPTIMVAMLLLPLRGGFTSHHDCPESVVTARANVSHGCCIIAFGLACLQAICRTDMMLRISKAAFLSACIKSHYLHLHLCGTHALQGVKALTPMMEHGLTLHCTSQASHQQCLSRVMQNIRARCHWCI